MSNTTMDDTLNAEPSVRSDGKMVVFVASVHQRSARCFITRAALEQHFWLPPRADNRRMLKAFADGQPRIFAVAERRMLKTLGEPIILTPADFAGW